ncbi:MAG TPA: PQQ-binding-like beta-propeller repeat protein [Gemmataceae bacterium]|nr:PQQ-binding-like beta-propeller repeat protein [Gemmataceae bacterium]
MGWPLSQDYNEAVQAPRACFADPDLKAGQVAPGPFGLPLPRSGNFADVYQVTGPDGRAWAVKCFTRPAAGLRERYEKIDHHLRAARLPFTVGFQFLAEGVRIRNLWYPVLKMEWVEGLALNEFVRQHLGRPEHLRALLGMWVRLCKRLRDAKIAHADLQQGNVLLVPGATANKLRLRLIDYDGMWVPELAGKPSGEAGHPAYQHPARLRERAYSADVDRFGHLVIGCALRALAVAGNPLWDRFDNGDNLLFREPDFADPGGSKVFRELWNLDDPTVTNLVALLVLSAKRPLGETPWLDEVLSGDQPTGVSDAVLDRAAGVLGVARRAARKAVPPAQIYVVPEEANEFADLGADGWSPNRAARRPQGSLWPLMAAGGLAVLAVGVVGVLSWRGAKPDVSNDLTSIRVPLIVEKPAAPDPRWARMAPGPAVVGVQALSPGIDPGTDKSKVVRSYLPKGSSSLGAWFLPDGTRGVFAHPGGVAIVDLATGQANRIVTDLADLARATVSRDGKFAVVAGQDRVIHCFDLPSGFERWTATSPGPVEALAVTPDARRIAASGEAGLVEWSAADGAEVRRNAAFVANHFCFTADGSRALAVAGDGVSIWNLEDGTTRLIGPEVAAEAVCVTADGSRAYAVGSAKEVKGWNLADGEPLPDRPRGVRFPATALAATSDGTLVVGGQFGEFAVVPSDGVPSVGTLAVDAGRVAGLDPTADGRHVVVATEKGAAFLVRVVDPRPAESVPPAGALDFVRSAPVLKGAVHVAANPAGDRLLAASTGKAVVYQADTFRAIAEYTVPGDRLGSAALGLGDTLIVSEEFTRPRVYSWDWSKEKRSPAFELPPGSFKVLAIRPVPGRAWALVTTSSAGDSLFEIETGKLVEDWPAVRTGDRIVAAPSPDGGRIAFGTSSRPVQFWRANAATFDPSCEGSVGVEALAFTPDGRQLVGLWPFGRIRIWDADTGKLVREVDHPLSGRFSGLAALGDDLIAVAVSGRRVLTNIETGKVIDTGKPETLAEKGATVSRRRWVLSLGADDKLTAWHVSAKRALDLPEAALPPGPWPDARITRDAPAAPVGATFTAGGRRLVVASEDGKLVRYSGVRLTYEGEVTADERPLRAVAQAADQVFTLGRNSVVVRYAQTLEKAAEFPVTPPTGPGSAVFAVHAEGTSFLLGTDRVRMTDVKSKKETVVPPPTRAGMNRALTQFAYSADGKVGVSRWGNLLMLVWRPGMSGEPKVLEDLKAAVSASPDTLALTPDGKFAVLGLSDGRLTVWDTANGKEKSKDVPPGKPAPGDAIVAVAILNDGKRVAVARADGRTVVYELDGLKKLKEYRGLPGERRLVVSPDGRSLLMIQPGAMQVFELPE